METTAVLNNSAPIMNETKIVDDARREFEAWSDRYTAMVALWTTLRQHNCPEHWLVEQQVAAYREEAVFAARKWELVSGKKSSWLS